MVDQSKTKSPDELSYEVAFTELENVVTAIESGDLNLESSVALFERGQSLIERCIYLLNAAELRIKKASMDQSNEVNSAG